MARGGKRNFKGRGKSFTNPEALERDRIKKEKERAWRRQRGIESDSDEEDSDQEKGDSSGNEASGSGSDDGIAFSNDAVGAAGAAAGAAAGPSKSKKAAVKGKPHPGGDSSSSEEDSDDEDRKPKGVEGLIEISNPNLMPKKNKKVSQLDNAPAAAAEKPQLSRREREEIEKQRAKARYQKMHAEGKTDEARADLARLAIIKKQREDAAKKREAERLAKENVSKTKQDEVAKAVGRRK